MKFHFAYIQDSRFKFNEICQTFLPFPNPPLQQSTCLGSGKEREGGWGVGVGMQGGSERSNYSYLTATIVLQVLY